MMNSVWAFINHAAAANRGSWTTQTRDWMYWYSGVYSKLAKFPAVWMHMPGGVGTRDMIGDYPVYTFDPLADAAADGWPNMLLGYTQLASELKRRNGRCVSYVGRMYVGTPGEDVHADPRFVHRGRMRPDWMFRAGAAMDRLRPGEIGLDSVGSISPDGSIGQLVEHLLDRGDTVWIEASWDAHTSYLRQWLSRYPELRCMSMWDQWSDKAEHLLPAKEWAFFVRESGPQGAYDVNELKQVLKYGHALCVPWWFSVAGVDPKTIVA